MKILILHSRSLLNALRRIITSPIEHLLYIASIACVISLFILSLVFGHNIDLWQQTNINYPQVTVYLKANATTNNISTVEKFINKYNNKVVNGYQYISKEQALSNLNITESLAQDMSQSINNFSNPLSDVIIISTKTANNKLLDKLQHSLASLSIIENISLDMQYASKISNILKLTNYAISSLSLVFLLILILIIYSLIKLQLFTRTEEVIISRLIGAPNNFISRPLVHYIMLQVVVSFILASYLIKLIIELINSNLIQVELISNTFQLTNLSMLNYCIIFIGLLIFSYSVIFITIRLIFKYKQIK